MRLTMSAGNLSENTCNGPAVENSLQNHVVRHASEAVRPRPREALLPHRRMVVWCMQFFGGVLVILFFVIPAFIKIYPNIVADVAFLNKLRWPPFANLSLPEEFELNGTYNFYHTANDVTLGAWHILPEELAASMNKFPPGSRGLSSLLAYGMPVILYLHGNAGTRAGWHRVQLYKVLMKAGFHVVTFDYRGYGDSSGHPSEEGLVEDSFSIFKWLKQQTGSSPVYIWGHSLGSAVATKTARRLCKEGVSFTGLILESPFNNFEEAVSNHPFSLPFRVLPWFSWVFIEGIKLNHIHFASDENIMDVTVPVIILHAVDDGIVPYELGRKLYDAAIRRTAAEKVEFVTFDSGCGYGHKHIHKAPELIPVIRKFMAGHDSVLTV